MKDQHKPKTITDEKVLNNVSAESRRTKSRIPHKSKGGIVVKGHLRCGSAFFQMLFSPVPGDEIVGFVTRGRGVSIHRTDCINIMNLTRAGRKCPFD